MSTASETLRHAFNRTKANPGNSPRETAGRFLRHVQETSSSIGFPMEGQIGESVAFALLNREAPENERRIALNTAIDTSRKEALTKFLPVIGVDGETILERADEITNKFVSGVIEAAAVYPKKPKENTNIMQDLFKILNPSQPTTKDKAVSAVVVSKLFQPYLVDRLLALDIYDPDKLRDQMKGVKRDARLMKGFYDSTKHAIELAVDGETSIPVEDLTEQLFQIGPIFAKLAQGLNLPDVFAAKIPDQEKATVVTQIARGMQEGIAPPDEMQQQDLSARLPKGLVNKGVISSASIAHVLATQTETGEKRATKVKRAGIEQAINDNEDLFNLVATSSARFVEEYAKGTTLGERVKRVNSVLPFLLRTFVDDLKTELDFPKETAAQKKGGIVFERHAGIHVPKVDDAYTDGEHISMEYVEGVRLEDLPPHENHLKNLFVVVLEQWKSRFLHGDMHGGNVKGLNDDDGSLVLYDWGKSVDLKPAFVKNMAKFMYAVARKNPDKLAKAYVKIQSPNYTQVTEDEAREVAQDVIDSLVDPKEKREDGKKGSGVIGQTIKGLTIGMGIRHQSILDSQYRTAMETAVRYGMVVAKELEKYPDKRERRKVLRKSIARAIKAVYFSRSKEK